MRENENKSKVNHFSFYDREVYTNGTGVFTALCIYCTTYKLRGAYQYFINTNSPCVTLD